MKAKIVKKSAMTKNAVPLFSFLYAVDKCCESSIVLGRRDVR